MEGPSSSELANTGIQMKILLNGLAAVYPLSGVAQYTIQLGRSLEALLGPENIFWFGKNSSNHNFELYNNDPSFINRFQHNIKKGLRQVPGSNVLIYIWRNNRFGSYARTVKPSLYHETKYTPFNFEDGPTLVTIYDLSFVRHPEWHPLDRVKFYEKYSLKQLSRVEAIITISEFSKKEISDLLNIDRSKIHVTYPGVDPIFAPGKKRIHGLPNRYILHLGNLEPRKNLPLLLDAYQSLPGSFQDKYPLVIAGAKGWCTDEIEKKLRLLRKNGKVTLMGYVPQRSLPDLYRGASLFVYPSFYEGFGLPPLEAMACGVPVIVSNTTSLPEVVGDAGIYVDPNDTEQISVSIDLVLSDPQLHRALSEKGIERAKLFSWEKTARETLTLYKKLVT